MRAFLNGQRVGNRTAARMAGWGPGTAEQCKIQSSPSAFALNDANRSVGWAWRVGKGEGGTVAKIGAFTEPATEAGDGAIPAYRLVLVTLDASGDGTTTPMDNAQDEAWVGSATGFRYVNVTPISGSSPILTSGGYYCLRLLPGATAPNATAYCWTYRPKTGTSSRELPRYIETSAALGTYKALSDHYWFGAVQLTNGRTFGLPGRVNTTTPGSPGVPAFWVSAKFGQGGTLVKRGAKFIPPKTMEIDGFWGTVWPAAGQKAVDLELAAADGTTILRRERFTIPNYNSPGGSAVDGSEIPFADTWVVFKNNVYYLWVADATGAGASYQLSYYQLASGDDNGRSAFAGLENWWDAEINASNEIAITSNRVPWMGFRISAVYDD